MGTTQKSWQVIDETASPRSDLHGSPRNLNLIEPKPKYLKINAEGIAPANKKKFIRDKIPINSGKEIDFETGL